MCEIMEKLRAEGVEEGRAEGRVEGRAEGRVEGRAEGRAESLKITTFKMYKKGMDKELIAEITGLSFDEIDSLIRDSKNK